jgi:hypothetical protein
VTESAQPLVLQEVVLGAEHRPTERTRHFRGGELQPPPARLQIARYRDDPGFYLLYFDAEGEEQNDTYHLTLDDALHQAQFEFNVAPDDWRAVRE